MNYKRPLKANWYGRIVKHWHFTLKFWNLQGQGHRQRSQWKQLMKVYLHLMCERVIDHGLGTVKLNANYFFFFFFFLNLKKITRAPRGTDRSPEYNEYFCYKLDSRVKNLTKEWKEKHQHLITHASRSLLWIQFVAVAFRSEEENFWRGPPLQAMSTSSLPSFVNFH